MSLCCSLFAVSGYVAAIVCSSVHVDRPSASTSGGQSAGVVLAAGLAGAARGTVVVVVLEGVEDSARACLVRARHEATEVQVRQLEFVNGMCIRCTGAVGRTAFRPCRELLPWAVASGRCLATLWGLAGREHDFVLGIERQPALEEPRPWLRVS